MANNPTHKIDGIDVTTLEYEIYDMTSGSLKEAILYFKNENKDLQFSFVDVVDKAKDYRLGKKLSTKNEYLFHHKNYVFVNNKDQVTGKEVEKQLMIFMALNSGKFDNNKLVQSVNNPLVITTESANESAYNIVKEMCDTLGGLASTSNEFKSKLQNWRNKVDNCNDPSKFDIAQPKPGPRNKP